MTGSHLTLNTAESEVYFWAPDDVSGVARASFEGESPFPLLSSPLRSFAMGPKDFVIPDSRSVRSMSRNALMAAHLACPLKSQLRLQDPYRVGLYLAVENGSIDYSLVPPTRAVGPDAFASTYKELRNPKMYLKQLPNLAGAQLGIFLGLLGPMVVMTHSRFGMLQALDQARLDLSDSRVDQALVVGVSSLEDPLNVLKQQQRFPGKGVSEAAVAMILNSASDKLVWKKRPDLGWSYGVLTEFVEQAARTQSFEMMAS